MKISCEVIKDLLPQYHDGVCSNESKELVEDHLANCSICKAELLAMNEIFLMDNAAQNLNEAEAVIKLARRWKRGMIKALIKGIFITIVLVVFVLLIIFVFMDIRIMTIS